MRRYLKHKEQKQKDYIFDFKTMLAHQYYRKQNKRKTDADYKEKTIQLQRFQKYLLVWTTVKTMNRNLTFAILLSVYI